MKHPASSWEVVCLWMVLPCVVAMLLWLIPARNRAEVRALTDHEERPVLIEQLDADGNVMATFVAARFVLRTVGEVAAYHGVDPEAITEPDGSVVFELSNGRRVVLDPPWRVR